MTAVPALTWRNWARTHHATATAVAVPHSVGDVADAIRTAVAAGLTVKPVGSGHSFTDTAVTGGLRMHLNRLTGLVSVDRDRLLATVRAGTTLRDLNRLLAANGLALPNLGDIDAQTVGSR